MAGERGDVAARAAELVDGLGSPDAGVRRDAARRSRELVRCWRGPYGPLIATLGDRLDDRDAAVRSEAACAFERMYSVAGPAADALAERVASEVDLWDGAGPAHRDTDRRRMAAALARLGDRRAVPMLAANIDRHPRLAVTVVLSLGWFRDHVDDFVPRLRGRLAHATPALSMHRGEALLAVVGLRRIGGVEALPELLDLLPAAVARQDRTLAREVLRTLATFGPVAGIAEVHPYLSSPDPLIAVHAAQVLSALPATVDTVLPVLLPLLSVDFVDGQDLAFAALRRLGPAAVDASDRLRTLLHDGRELLDWTTGGHAIALWRLAVDSAVALWHVTGDTDAVLPTLVEAWPGNPHRRTDIVDCLADLGPAAAPALPLVETEVAAAQRYWTGEVPVPTDLVERDETLVRKCRAVLAACC
ncbi:hypothetical protein [Rugosimonospora africana]|uniref:HEAT repeat-containing protein n=1 Tax=Rugosimonospora africana TaxID=556532 RepID=A0A8J3QX41_9ACTN|nr:hypothetical protein [Rugosimonospora africana]GIH17722.1 hypothetical protein Raf01_58940 [Rugosimonospora africana]